MINSVLIWSPLTWLVISWCNYQLSMIAVAQINLLTTESIIKIRNMIWSISSLMESATVALRGKHSPCARQDHHGMIIPTFRTNKLKTMCQYVPVYLSEHVLYPLDMCVFWLLLRQPPCQRKCLSTENANEKICQYILQSKITSGSALRIVMSNCGSSTATLNKQQNWYSHQRLVLLLQNRMYLWRCLCLRGPMSPGGLQASQFGSLRLTFTAPHRGTRITRCSPRNHFHSRSEILPFPFLSSGSVSSFDFSFALASEWNKWEFFQENWQREILEL